jgi:hypothetical protein
MESLTVGVPYRIYHVVSPFADYEETTILQIERNDDDFVYITWPNCPFHPDDASRINNGMFLCTMTNMGQRITNDINRGHQFTRVVYIRNYQGFSRVG